MMEFLYIPYNHIIPFIPNGFSAVLHLVHPIFTLPQTAESLRKRPVKLSRLKRPSCKAWREKDHPIRKRDSKKDTTHPWSTPQAIPRAPTTKGFPGKQPVGKGLGACVLTVC